MNMTSPVGRCLLVCIAVSLTWSAAEAGAKLPPSAQDLKRLSLEELMQIDVTSVNRRAEPVGTSAAAISIITADDIRRSGVTTIPDALQLADGMHVARFNNGSWRIAARGFNGDSPNKLLVMIDGRTVYSPLFTGVFWNVLDYVLEDIERIEVIRGPGAVLWGANAVNGVINIITRNARDTQGLYASLAAGNEDPAIAEFRYGGTTAGLSWRAYGKVASRDAQQFASGLSSRDDRDRGQVGVRFDGGEPQGTNWLLKADAFHSADSFPDRPDGEFTDAAVQGRLSALLAPSSRLVVQSYYRREYRRVPRQLTHHINVLDFDAQHSLARPRHAIVWGGGMRTNWDQTYPSATIGFDPPARTYRVSSLFGQDEITLLPGRLSTTIGAKYEHNAFSGGELQPNVRARLTLLRSQTLWGAVSRAVRRPTRLDSDVIVSGATGAPSIVGAGDFRAEKLVAYELGYRIQPVPLLSVEATLFRHDYDDLRSQDLPPSGFPLVIGNSLEGSSQGVELSANIQPTDRWRTHISYTRLESEVTRKPGSRDIAGGVGEANDPGHVFAIRTSVDISRLEVDGWLRTIGQLPKPVVPGFTELNLRLGWRLSERIELSLAGQDLLHDAHPESGPASPTRVEFERAVRAGITLRY